MQEPRAHAHLRGQSLVEQTHAQHQFGRCQLLAPLCELLHELGNVPRAICLCDERCCAGSAAGGSGQARRQRLWHGVPADVRLHGAAGARVAEKGVGCDVQTPCCLIWECRGAGSLGQPRSKSRS